MADADQDQNPTPEQEAATAAADFTAGYDAIQGADPSNDEPTSKDADAAAPPEADGKEGEELFAGYTAAELKAALAKSARVDALEKQLRNTNGKIGELNAALLEINRRQSTPPAGNGKAEGGTATEDDEDLEADYPDIVRLADKRARKIVDDVLLKTQQTQPAFDRDALAAEVEAKVQYEVQQMLLTSMHDGWQTTIGSDDYKIWLATQTPEIQERATATPHARELGKIISQFKESVKAKENRGKRDQQRLEGALTPEGVRGGRQAVTPSELDEFHAGFASVRGR